MTVWGLRFVLRKKKKAYPPLVMCTEIIIDYMVKLNAYLKKKL